MDFWDATKLMVRRWYLTVPMLLLTLAGTGYTATAIKADYVLTSYVQLIPSQTALTEEETLKYPVNPWNQLGLDAMSQAINYATVDHTFLQRLEREGYTTNLKITSGDPVAGATILVVGKTKEQAVETTDAVIKRYQDTALQLQAQYKVRTQDMITVKRLDQGENLDRPGGKVKRAIIAVFGVGILLTAALTIGVDALLRRRRRKGDSDGESSVAVNPAQVSNSPVSARAPTQPSVTVSGSAKAHAPKPLPTPIQAPPRDRENDTVRIQLPPVNGRNGHAKPATESAVRNPPPPQEVGEATIVLPGPRTLANDQGGKRH